MTKSFGAELLFGEQEGGYFDQDRMVVGVGFRDERLGKALIAVYGGHIFQRMGFKEWQLRGKKARLLIDKHLTQSVNAGSGSLARQVRQRWCYHGCGRVATKMQVRWANEPAITQRDPVCDEHAKHADSTLGYSIEKLANGKPSYNCGRKDSMDMKGDCGPL